MLITINPMLDMESLKWISNDGQYEYAGPLETFCSGGSVQSNDEALQSAQLQATRDLNSAYNESFSTQRALLSQQQNRLNYLVSNPLGLDKATLHSMVADSNDRISSAAKQALGSVAAFQASH